AVMTTSERSPLMGLAVKATPAASAATIRWTRTEMVVSAATPRSERSSAAHVEHRLVLPGEGGPGEILGDRRRSRGQAPSERGAGGEGLCRRLSDDDETVGDLEAGGKKLAKSRRLASDQSDVGSSHRTKGDDAIHMRLGRHDDRLYYQNDRI